MYSLGKYRYNCINRYIFDALIPDLGLELINQNYSSGAQLWLHLELIGNEAEKLFFTSCTSESKWGITVQRKFAGNVAVFLFTQRVSLN